MQNDRIHLEVFTKAGIEVFLKREDLIHPEVSGNKYRKLKYNLKAVQEGNYSGLLTFGGAYSNHIAAAAFACYEAGIPCAGVIRGEELKSKPLNETLSRAKDLGMQLVFADRETYRLKATEKMQLRWKEAWPGYFILPEGGCNDLAVAGCAEILEADDAKFHVICTPAGTGGTMAGLICGSDPGQRVLGFPALKGDFLKSEIAKFVEKSNWDLVTRFHFGGYAKVNEELITFINFFKQETGIALDPVYTGKMMFGIVRLAGEGFFEPGTRVLAIHTGGLQGIKGMNTFLRQKNIPPIQ
ncbi:1-aminocyclopropane-1-carboxylate deaminase/D-cysteine desulfhydrase [Robertkochia flava]|uniref:1-aminocyclopropane-1-carboxylate deaminase/D-cysteine desulfhydrase n=1 Tax=Robertkochia flava TaxID=3447986 RepID=UPI001CCDAB67|nr:pyridoxal-phosphate dependent enzyme [Robertkochia marina]